MAELVSLPAPADESGIHGSLMNVARLAVETGEVVAYALVAVHKDGARTVGGRIDHAHSGVLNDPLFVGVVTEEVRAHFMMATEIAFALNADEEC